MSVNILSLLKRLLIALFSFLGLYFFIGYTINTDFHLHSEHIVNINKGLNGYPAPFIYYFLASLLTGFSENFTLILNTTLVLVALATTWKFHITYAYFSNIKIGIPVLGVTLGCMFFFAIPDPLGLINENLYLARFTPSVFHNSTLIIVMPFVLLLFLKQVEIIKKNYSVPFKDWFYLFILIVCSVFIKPSYLFVFIPGALFFLFTSFKNRPMITTLKSSLVYFMGLGLIGLSFWLVFFMQQGAYTTEKSSIVLSLFNDIKAYYPFWNFPIAFLFSFAFVFAFLAFNWKSVLKNVELKFSFLGLLGAFPISFFISETGRRKGHGNFSWQLIAAYYLVLISIVKFSIEKYQNGEMSKAEKNILLTLFLIHVASGVNYIFSFSYFGHI